MVFPLLSPSHYFLQLPPIAKVSRKKKNYKFHTMKPNDNSLIKMSPRT